jgi:mannosyltransferase OCH1-like enzyme
LGIRTLYRWRDNRFFYKNPLNEFPLIVEKFNSIKGGAHKADLFRYYYLYINGGVFLDSDAMLQTKIINCAENYDFFTVDYRNTHSPIISERGYIDLFIYGELLYNN